MTEEQKTEKVQRFIIEYFNTHRCSQSFETLTYDVLSKNLGFKPVQNMLAYLDESELGKNHLQYIRSKSDRTKITVFDVRIITVDMGDGTVRRCYPVYDEETNKIHYTEVVN